MKSLEAFRSKVNRLMARRDAAMLSLGMERLASFNAVEDEKEAIGARDVVQAVAQAVQQSAQAQIAAVVSRCLETVFDEPYTFQIRFEQKRGRTEAVLVFLRDGAELDDPLNEVGGGVVDVAAFALRLACVLMARPAARKLLCLDEPFRFLAKCYRPRVREMLGRLATDLEMQFLVVTHLDDLRMGTVMELGKDGESNE